MTFSLKKKFLTNKKKNYQELEPPGAVPENTFIEYLRCDAKIVNAKLIARLKSLPKKTYKYTRVART
jgi:hypothetical protein